ncbi:hypothetical protein JZU61_04570 [bacterium]|jgi:hypothetical protein|nr:hypothetical protein [bacterium]
MSKVGKELAKLAKQKGICQEWLGELRTAEDKEKMLEMYVKGIDFCLSNDYPSNDYIRANFVGIMEKHGIHLDENLHLVNDRKVIALGTCSGNIHVSGYNVSEIFLKHESELALTADENSFVMVDMFDNTRLRVTASEEAKVCINHYGGEIVFEQHGNAVVKIIEKNKKTY